MGSCCSQSVEDNANSEINHKLLESSKHCQKGTKVLLLGPKGSGKTTFIKQLTTIHGEGYSETQRMTLIPKIHKTIISNMTTLINHCNISQLSTESQQAAKHITSIKDIFELNHSIVSSIKTLWNETKLRDAFEIKMQNGNEQYYFWEIDRINAENYIPTDKDILLLNHPKPFPMDIEFNIRQAPFKVINPLGHNSNWYKYKHLFTSIDAVIFVASLVCYDSELNEQDLSILIHGYIRKHYYAESIPEELMKLIMDFSDIEGSDMHAQLEMFGSICNDPMFEQTPVILFLNKKDIFASKIQHKPLNDGYPCFENFGGDGSNYDDGVGYIRNIFEGMNENPRMKQIFTHVTCATDKCNTEKVFGDVIWITSDAPLARS